MFHITLLRCFAPLNSVRVNIGSHIIPIIAVHINSCTMHVFAGRERHAGLRAAGFCRFSLFFMNGMNNYPGVAANSEETSQTLPSYRPQPTRRKTCRNTHQIPALYSLALRLSLSLTSFLCLCFSLFRSLLPRCEFETCFSLTGTMARMLSPCAFSPFIYLFFLSFWITQILGCKTSYNMRGSY